MPTPPSPRPKEAGAGRRDLSGSRDGALSHDRATLSFLLLEGGGEQVGLAGKVQQSFGEAARGAGLRSGLELIDAGHSCCAEDTVDALL